MQKGRPTADPDGQWKLQLEAGARASCSVAAKGSGVVYTAVSPVPVNDGAWHSVTCTRTASQLTIQVGTSTGTFPLSPGRVLDVANVLRLGGDSLQRRTIHQFFGALDNVFFRIGAL